MSAPVLIGIDWGTSSFRAVLMDAAGAALDQVAGPQGILAVPDGDFEGHLCRSIGHWLADHPDLPMITSGMITSRNGWVETPYLPMPLTEVALAAALVPHRLASGRVIHFVTGTAMNPAGGLPDVMRGEETEIIGHLAKSGGASDLFVLPGTHSKWADVQGGALIGFQTCMTGEVFALLCQHSILGRLMTTGQPDPDAFLRGVRTSGESQAGLLGRLFSARTLVLFERLGGDSVADYLSGLLVGEEFRAALVQHPPGALLTIIGRGDLAARYHAAAEAFGYTARVAEPGLACHGQLAIARAAGLVRR